MGSKDKLISVRVDSELLKRLNNTLGTDDSKTIRASMNCCEFVIHTLFGGEVRHIFTRDRKTELKNRYDLPEKP